MYLIILSSYELWVSEVIWKQEEERTGEDTDQMDSLTAMTIMPISGLIINKKDSEIICTAPCL